MKCIVCNKTTDWFEPWFGYSACEEHKNIIPIYIQEYAKEYKLKQFATLADVVIAVA